MSPVRSPELIFTTLLIQMTATIALQRQTNPWQ